MTRSRFRVRTVVVGLIALAVSGAVLLSNLTSVSVDGGTVALLVVLATGAALLAEGLVSVRRSRP